MAELPSLDPFAFWRDLVSQVEKGVIDFAGQSMKSDGVANGMNKALSASLVTKKVTKELMQRYFEALNLPTRPDIQALGERLQKIEDRLIGISATLDRLAGGKPLGHAGLTLPVPSRTRKPPVREPVAVAPAPVAPRKSKKTAR